MSQSKRMSFVEACANIGIGYGIAIVAQIFILPLVGVDITLGKQFVLANYMTVVSLVRSYILRRFFNRLHSRKS